MASVDGSGNPVSFQIKFVTADRKRKTGGEIINIPQACLCQGYRKGKHHIDIRPSANLSVATKNPNHWANSTRNLLLPNGGIRAVHIRLIIEFNNQIVYF